MSITLRDYQHEAASAAINANKKSVLIVAPCGSGKTIIFSEIARRLNTKTLILAHSLELIEQTREKLILVWPEADVGIVDATTKQWDRHVIVATVQSCYREGVLETINSGRFELVICDEAHRFIAKTAMDVIKAANPAKVVGFTATPFRGDKKGLKEVFDEIVFERNYPWAIARGLLCPPVGIKMETNIDTSQLKVSGDDYTEASLVDVVATDEVTSAIVSAAKEHATGRRSICFAINISHANTLSRAFNAAGLRSDVVHSQLDGEARERALEALRNGSIDILCNVGVLIEGFDEPSVDCAIMARPTKSRGLYIQATGRALRLYDKSGKAQD